MSSQAIQFVALGVAGFALFAYYKKSKGTTAARRSDVDQVYGMARDQRREVGAAVVDNTGYINELLNLDRATPPGGDYFYV
jgi:hypothetical protein